MDQGLGHSSELFVFRKDGCKRLLDSDVLFRTFSEGQQALEDGNSCHRNFIYFCGVVQALGIDFLPISWQPQRGYIGRGGTSNVHQSLLTLETSLAFKAIDVEDISRQRTTGELEAIYATLLAEIQPMACRAVLNSPYIHKVDGICWNYNSKTNLVDPVLVYEKAAHGDMYRYMMLGQGKLLDVSGKIRLCRDVAEGLHVLQACNIIHGDVKPQNILMVDFGNGLIVPQIADFGYSTKWTNTDSQITLSRTEPWYAPELDKQRSGYTVADAVRTDVFSFGMLCLWLIFSNEIANRFGVTREFVDNYQNVERETDLAFGKINRLKNQDQLRGYCKDQIQLLHLQQEQKQSLFEVFEMTLSPDASARTISFRSIWERLHACLDEDPREPYEVSADTVLDKATDDWHCGFEISKSILQLTGADVRVREQIARHFLDQAEYATCPKCRSDAAFQYSICLAIGFGIASSEILSQKWLHQSGRNETDFDYHIAQMSGHNQTPDPHLYSTNFLNNLHNAGDLRAVDHFNVYRSHGSLDLVQKSYEREVTDLKKSLGATSMPSMSLSLVFASLLKSIGDYNRALSIQEECLQYFQSNAFFGGENLNTQTTMIEVADTYRLLGKFEEAALYCETIKRQETGKSGLDDTYSLLCLRLEAQLLRDEGHYQDSEEVFKQLIARCEAKLGKCHSETFKAMNDLAGLYMDLMRYEEALELFTEESRLSQQVFGPLHPSVIIGLNNLSILHIQREEFAEAQNILEIVRFRLERTPLDAHPLYGIFLANSGKLYFELNEYQKSIDCYEEALSRIRAVLGSEHPYMAVAFMGQALTLAKDATCHEAANESFQKCLQIQERALGVDHPEVLVSLQEYSHFLCERQEFERAEIHLKELLVRQQTRLGKDHGALIETFSLLGETMDHLGNGDAEGMYRRAAEMAKEVVGEDNEFTWTYMRKLASHLHQHGTRLKEAESIYRSLIAFEKANVDEHGAALYEDLDDFCQILCEQNNFVEAEKVQRYLIKFSEPYLEDDDDMARSGHKFRLAQILSKLRNFSSAVTILRECVNLMNKVEPKDWERSLEISADLAWNLENDGQSEEALVCICETLQATRQNCDALQPVQSHVGAIAAGIYFRQGNREKAMELSREVIRIGKIIHGPGSKQVQAAETNHALYGGQIPVESGS